MSRWKRRPPWVRLLIGSIGLLAVFYALPVSTQAPRIDVPLGFVVTFAGIALLAWAISEQVSRSRRGMTQNIPPMFMLLNLVVVFFALTYFVLTEHFLGQMEGIVTRTDSLYFTVTTLGTVGFGDVHAVGQFARALVTLQIIFDFVFRSSAGHSHRQQPARPPSQGSTR